MGTNIQKIFFAIIFVIFIHSCNSCSKVLSAGELSSSCSGSITLYDDAGSTCSRFTSTMESLREGLRVNMAKLEGCGCYVLYEESYRRGRSFAVNRRGKQRIGLEVVKSVYRKDCKAIDVNF